jgi:hypothetical protein
MAGSPRAGANPGMRMNMATLLWGVVFGSIGMGYFVYGKRQSAPVPLVCGIGLMIFPYFVSSTWATVLVGALLMAVPYFVRF